MMVTFYHYSEVDYVNPFVMLVSLQRHAGRALRAILNGLRKHLGGVVK